MVVKEMSWTVAATPSMTSYVWLVKMRTSMHICSTLSESLLLTNMLALELDNSGNQINIFHKNIYCEYPLKMPHF